MPTVICEYCSNDIEIELKTTKVTETISKVYFNCEVCRKEYIAYHITQSIIDKQNKMQQLVKQQRLNRHTKDTSAAHKLNTQYHSLKKQVKKEMEQVEEEVQNL